MNIQTHQFIKLFEPAIAAELCQVATIEDYPEQAIIFEEGQTADYLYLILIGEVEFQKHTVSHQYQTIGRAIPNDFFGEFGIIDGLPRSAQVIAASPCTIAKIHYKYLTEAFGKSNGLTVLKLFQKITNRIRITNEQFIKQIIHKEKMVILGEMLNTVIHDLKSPMTGIQLSNKIIQELHSDEETTEWCELIEAQIERMLSMAEEALEYAKGTTNLNRKALNIAKLLQRFQKLNHIYLEEAKVTLNIQAADCVINADENKLMRVFQNLVVNSVEAFNGRPGRIDIIVTQEDNALEVQVKDNGPGIPPQILPRLFEPFVTYGKRGGTGLGTAITKSILEAHGGGIACDTGPKGTTFYIFLPFHGESRKASI